MPTSDSHTREHPPWRRQTKPQHIDWEIATPETGGTPKRDPRKATFRWHDGDAVIKTQDFTQEELEAQIRRLEQREEEVPAAYRDALRSFQRGGRWTDEPARRRGVPLGRSVPRTIGLPSWSPSLVLPRGRPPGAPTATGWSPASPSTTSPRRPPRRSTS